MLPLSFGQEVANEGDLAQLTCVVVSGDEPVSLSWSFHGADISSNQLGIRTTDVGSRMSLLIIESVGHRHRGSYTCKAKNAAGAASSTAVLRVNG